MPPLAGVPSGRRGSRPLERTGFVAEDFEVVIELDRLAAAGDDPFMSGDWGAAVEDDQLGRAQRDTHLPADQPGRD